MSTAKAKPDTPSAVTIWGYATERDPACWWQQDSGAEVWGFNPPGGYTAELVEKHGVARWFELHDLDIHRQRERWAYLDWLGKLAAEGTKVYTLDGPVPRGIPGSLMFPRGSMLDRLVPLRSDYHCGSVDWTMAYAIALGVPKVVLAGMDFSGGEPDSARACLEYWVGFAEGRGCTVEAPGARVLLGNWQATNPQWEDLEEPYGYSVAYWPTDAERRFGQRYRNGPPSGVLSVRPTDTPEAGGGVGEGGDAGAGRVDP